MKKLALVGLLLALVATGLVYWALTARIETQLERVAGQVAVWGRLTWGTVRVDPRGSVSIRSLRFVPIDRRDSITISQLELHAGSLPALLRFSDQIQDGRLPQQAGISVRGLKMPVTPAMETVSADQLGLILPLAAAGCPGFEQLSLYDLTELDYWELRMDAELDYRVGVGLLEIKSRLSVADLSLNRQSWRLELESAPEMLRNLPRMLAQARLQRVELEHSDQGFHQRLVNQCVERSGLTFNHYQRRHIQSWLNEWSALGMEPGRLVVAGYRHYLSRPGRITLIAEPEPPPQINILRQRSVADILIRTAPSFVINDGTPVELTVSPRPIPVMPEPVVPERLTRPERIVRPQADDADNQPVIIVGPIPDWKAIELARVSSHYGDSARIELRDGATLHGRIVSSDVNSLQLLSRSRGGEYARPVAFDQIERIQVRP